MSATLAMETQIRDLLTDLVRRAANDRVSVTVTEATHMLGLKDTRITKRLIAAGDIRARKVRDGNTWLVSVKSLEDYIDGPDHTTPLHI
mgnify:CR=1 FL=1